MIDRQGKKTFASEARHYITVQGKVLTPDGDGGFTEGWSDRFTLAAAVSPIRATQQFQYKSINVDASHLIKVRGQVEISEQNRIKFGSRIFEVLTVEDIQERGVLKVVTCKESR